MLQRVDLSATIVCTIENHEFDLKSKKHLRKFYHVIVLKFVIGRYGLR